MYNDFPEERFYVIMNCEFNIVGIAKGHSEDMRSLYEKLGAEVFAAAFAVVKNKKLARDIAVETFRRVKTEAYSFDTDYSGEYWVLDIATQLALNSQSDPEIAGKCGAISADNASVLITDALELKNDRGFILLVKSCSGLSIKDVANLSGYYNASAGAEFRRGCARLAEKHEELSKAQIPAQIRKDMVSMCPDYYGLIDDEENPTVVSHISHEALGLNVCETSYTPDTEEADIGERAKVQKAQKKSKLKKILIAVGAALFVCAVVVAVLLIYNNYQNSLYDDDDTRVIQTGTTCDMQCIGGVLYYRTDSGIYSWNPDKSAKPSRISDIHAREMTNDGNMLYIRSASDGKIYSIDPTTGAATKLSSISGTSLAIFGDYIYFSASDGIYRMPKTGSEEPEVIYTDETDDSPIRYHMSVTDEGLVVFSAGSEKGIFYIDSSLETPAVMALYFDEVYYFQLYGGKIYFDALEFSYKNIYALDIQEKSMVQLPLISYTAAYYVYDGVIYYEGATYSESGVVESCGLYALSLDSDTPELLFDIPLDSTQISEIYVSDGRIFCYYSDGEKDGSRSLKAYSLDDVSSCQKVF